jgi:hypothetical protein
VLFCALFPDYPLDAFYQLIYLLGWQHTGSIDKRPVKLEIGNELRNLQQEE